MSRVKISSVVSCSSQDPRYPASNLTRWPCEKWLCQPSDAKHCRAEVTLKLRDSCTISAIDIGNHGSFSVEVQVGRGDKFYETLLNPTTFMSVAESRKAVNVSQMKMFKSQDFDSATRTGVWDTVKIICTQPHRRDKVFGLAIVKVMSDSVSVDLSCHKTPSRCVEDFIKQHRQPSAKESPQEKWFNGMREESLKQITNTGQKSSSNRGLNMVMASSKTPTYKTPLVQEMLNQKSSPSASRPTFMGSVRTFFRQLDFRTIDPLNTNVSDLRHKFEKLKARKLSSDEKKLFKKYTLDYCANQFEGREMHHADGRTPVKKPPVDAKTLKLANELTAQMSQSPKEQTTPKFQLDHRFGKTTPAMSSVPCAEKGGMTLVHRMNSSQTDGQSWINSDICSPFPKTSETPSPITHQPVNTLHSSSPPTSSTHVAENSTSSDWAVSNVKSQLGFSGSNNGLANSSTSTTPLISRLTHTNGFTKQDFPLFSTSPVTSKPVIAKAASSQNLHTPSRLPTVNRRSTAFHADAHSTPRLEIKPSMRKRTLDDLLDDDDDDLLLPVAKAPTLAVNVSASSGTKSLTLDDLLSSEDEDDPVADVGKDRSGCAMAQTPLLPSVNGAQDVIVLSDDEDELPDLVVVEDVQASVVSHDNQETTTPGTVQCPICMHHFQQSVIEAHASDCVIVLD